MDINGINKNILKNNSKIVKNRNNPISEIAEGQDEFISPKASLASKAYAISKISDNKPSLIIREYIKKYRPEMPGYLKKDILSAVAKDNVNIGQILISDDGITDGMIKEVLETTNAKNENLRIDTHKFLKEHQEDFGKYYSFVTVILLKNMDDYSVFYQLPNFLEKAKNQCGENHSLLSKMMGSFAHNSENADYLLDTFTNNREKFGSDSNESILNALFDKSHLFTNVLESFVLDEYLQDKNLYNNEALRELIIPIVTSEDSPFGKKDAMECIAKSNFDPEEIRKLKKEGYQIFFEKLQDTGEYDIVFKKQREEMIDNIKNINPNGEAANLYETEDTVRLTPDGQIIKSKCERYALMNGRLERTTTADGRYTCDSYYRGGTTSKILTKEVRVVNGVKGPLYVQETNLSDILDGVYDTTFYNLAQTDKNLEGVLSAIKKVKIDRSSDILEEIKKAGIKGWNFSRTVENPDGTKTHIEKFQKGDLHTQRKYTTNDDETKTSLDYTISDTKGKKLLNIHRTFEMNGNTSITTVNNKRYQAEFDDENMTVKIEGEEINFKEKMKEIKEKEKEILWNLIKRTPGDLILKLKNLESLKYEASNGHWSNEKNRISSNNDLGTLSHEIGHLIDDNFRKSQERYTISNNRELIKIYNSEIEDFKRNISEGEMENIKYFSQTGGSAGTGLSELVAEVNALTTTQRNLDVQTRDLFLTRYFPKTAAKIAELLGYK